MSKQCSYNGCTREVHGTLLFPETDKCIFHAEKKYPQEFRNALAKQIREWRRAKADEWDFSGFVFVDVEREDKYGGQSYNLFRRALFPVTAAFNRATFSGDAGFERATFSEVAWFVRAIFSGHAGFDGAIFSRVARFTGATLSGHAGFNRATFSGDADFIGATCSEDAGFQGATFSGGAGFHKATFSRDAWFDGVTFSGVAGFLGATFEGNAWFQVATFSGFAGFIGATFSGGLDLSHASFAILGDFEKCRISGRVKMMWPGEGTKRDKEQQEVKRGTLQFKELELKEGGVLDLRDNILQEDSQLVFDTCKDMHYVLLKGTDCSQIRFYNCEWPEFRGRKVVGDEYILRKGRPDSDGTQDKRNPKKSAEWNRIAITYQQLVKNFREKLDHPTANDFERGVFEMRRRAGLQRKNVHGLADYALISCYKWLSDYSGSLLRPLLWLLVSIPLFAFAYWNTSINYGVYKSFWNSLKLGVQIASLNRIGFEVIRDDLIRVDILAALQVVCTATLVALFLFAVRRRFKH